jgi:hypothetical protein
MEGTVGETMLFPFCDDMTRALLMRVGAIAVGVMALATACASDEPTTVRAAVQEPVVALVSAPPFPMAASAGTGLYDLLGSAPKSVGAGDPLNVDLLRRFYARHGFAPVWEARQGQANALMDAVGRASDHGLAPELFHTDLLRSLPTMPAPDRDLLLSSVFLSYADALARGAMPVERRRDDEILTPEPSMSPPRSTSPSTASIPRRCSNRWHRRRRPIGCCARPCGMFARTPRSAAEPRRPACARSR